MTNTLSLAKCFACSDPLSWKECIGGAMYPRCSKAACKKHLSPYDVACLRAVETTALSSTVECRRRNEGMKMPRPMGAHRTKILAHRKKMRSCASARFRFAAAMKLRCEDSEYFWPVRDFDTTHAITTVDEGEEDPVETPTPIPATTIRTEPPTLPVESSPLLGSMWIVDDSLSPTSRPFRRSCRHVFRPRILPNYRA